MTINQAIKQMSNQADNQANEQSISSILPIRNRLTLKLSQFTTIIDNHPDAGKHLLYNTLTRAMSSIDQKGLYLLEALPYAPYDLSVQKWLDALAQNGFVVPEPTDEGEQYIQRLENAKTNADHLHVTLSLIQGCNFGCVYCYQGGEETTHDGSRVLTSQRTASREDGHASQTESQPETDIDTETLVAFLKSECEAREVKRLHFTAYGGEPLLNKAALVEIVSSMSRFCENTGIEWSFDMVSNGSLLNRKTVLELKPYGFVQVQITLDGDREAHDANRPFLHVKGANLSTFDVIMRNLQRWANLIQTQVLCVVSESNIEAAHRLIDLLAELGLAEKQVRMKFSPVSPAYDEQTLSEVTQNFADNPELVAAEFEIIDAITKLEIHAAQRGLIEDLRPHGKWCAVVRANGQNLTITPDGKIYSCALFMGRDEKYETGHISNNERGGLDHLMKTFDYPDECKRCAYLPICANCRADALEKTGDILGANSQKAKFDAMLPQLIRVHYDLQQHRSK